MVAKLAQNLLTFLCSLYLLTVLGVSDAFYTRDNPVRKSPYTNVDDQQDICEDVASFTPNFCSYSSSQQYCYSFCQDRNERDSLTCGNKTIDGNKQRQVLTRFRRVVGGVQSRAGEWPWQVSLRVNGTQWCGGSILSKRFILTAAHCFDKQITSMNPKDWVIYAGDYALHAKDHGEQRMRAKRIFIHENFSLSLHHHRKGSWVTADNDIAIIELAHLIDLHHQSKAQICLPDNNTPTKTGDSCHVVGWGHTSYDGKQPDHLMHAVVMVIPTAICNLELAYNNTVNSEYLLCAGYKKGGIDACNYDSGGAMACVHNGRWHATGIVSSGFECARSNAYGLYTRVTADKKWIVDRLLKSRKKNPFF